MREVHSLGINASEVGLSINGGRFRRLAAFLGLLLTARRKATPLYEDDRERNLEPRLGWRGCRKHEREDDGTELSGNGKTKNVSY